MELAETMGNRQLLASSYAAQRALIPQTEKGARIQLQNILTWGPNIAQTLGFGRIDI
jgi:hypothetical protein